MASSNHLFMCDSQQECMADLGKREHGVLISDSEQQAPIWSRG